MVFFIDMERFDQIHVPQNMSAAQNIFHISLTNRTEKKEVLTVHFLLHNYDDDLFKKTDKNKVKEKLVSAQNAVYD
jgi:hypothetical protein